MSYVFFFLEKNETKWEKKKKNGAIQNKKMDIVHSLKPQYKVIYNGYHAISCYLQ